MIADTIKEIIKLELDNEEEPKNVFGADLVKHLIEPVLQTYRKTDLTITLKKYWTVFEERPDKKGYAIYFNEETKLFGLALMQDGELYDIGDYGTFLQTLNSL